MAYFQKLVQHGSYNILSKFYNQIGHEDIQKPIFIGGCSFYILGVEFKTKQMDKQLAEQPPEVYLQYSSAPAFFRISNLFWMTYRSGYEKLPNSSLTTDVGWGCTIRAMQMMIANAMETIVYSGALNNTQTPYIPTKEEIMNVLVPFIDSPNSTTPLSIHHVYESRFVVEKNKSGVNYLAPSVVAKAYSGLVNSWKLCPIRCVMCSNVSIPTHELSKLPFKPTLVFLPIVLNHLIHSKLQQIYKSKLFAGIVGGMGDRAIFVFGFHALQFLYLDPHIVQPSFKSFTEIDTKSYSPISTNRFSVHTIDPTKLDDFCTFGFLIKNFHEIDDFMKFAKEVFEISNDKELRTSHDLNGFEVLDF
ncbi:hypothetical protein, conserved [Entamoeba dispar SAW760]|uniref:Cysteine protease n=1 Tax=Entamoeba dispar (strain ATCC PRA-260 / SAW760) TaxID=370354 RepID=B0EBU2_ENTDS|nr:uncharacterized protein EDI_342370 [Entamoeba dispar SAW760]EDR28003.1 hypothetical protein, conserved [Entamoeba dispar SAW760]|eukprot:EDR28003.1 hypothetical protein, conserved [Entamoeba dispar SAW760]